MLNKYKEKEKMGMRQLQKNGRVEKKRKREKKSVNQFFYFYTQANVAPVSFHELLLPLLKLFLGGFSRSK